MPNNLQKRSDRLLQYLHEVGVTSPISQMRNWVSQMGCRAKIHTHICLTPDFKLLTQCCFVFLSVSAWQPMPEVGFSLVGELRVGGRTCGDKSAAQRLLRWMETHQLPPTLLLDTQDVSGCKSAIMWYVWIIPCTVTSDFEDLPPLRWNLPGGLGMESWKRRNRKTKTKTKTNVRMSSDWNS